MRVCGKIKLHRSGLLVGAIILAVLPLMVKQKSLLDLITLVGIFSITAMSLDLIKGYTGLLSLGQAAFMAIGGYASALLTVRAAFDPLLAMLLGMILAGAVAWLLGYSVVRLSVENAALVTLGLGIIMQNLFLGLRDFTGGGSGIAGVPPLSIFWLTIEGNIAYYYLVWLLVLLVFFLLDGVVDSRVGRALRTIKVDEQLAGALTINVYKTKLQVFVISAVISSFAGSLYVHFMRFISPDMVGLDASFSLITMVILGGEGTLMGSILGAGILKVIPQYVSAFRDYQLLINGLLLLVILRYMPRGIVGSLFSQRRGCSTRGVTVADNRVLSNTQDGEEVGR